MLNEFANVARRKLAMDWNELAAALQAVRTLARRVHPIDLEVHATALRLAQRYGLAVYDALIVASALRARCEVLYSGDMQDRLVIEDRLRIANPFQGSTITPP